jgi:hypothetical protein
VLVFSPKAKLSHANKSAPCPAPTRESRSRESCARKAWGRTAYAHLSALFEGELPAHQSARDTPSPGLGLPVQPPSFLGWSSLDPRLARRIARFPGAAGSEGSGSAPDPDLPSTHPLFQNMASFIGKTSVPRP